VPAKILNQRHFFFGFTSGCGNGGGTAELFSLISVTFPYEVSGCWVVRVGWTQIATLRDLRT